MFYRKDGKLTAYAFACGYVERYGEFRLYRDGVYHLQNDSGYWESFATVAEARRTLKAQLEKEGN